jgi:hypothetical protein
MQLREVRGHCICKELPVILVNKVVDPKRIIGKKWRAEEEERHKGSLTQKSHFFDILDFDVKSQHPYRQHQLVK